MPVDLAYLLKLFQKSSSGMQTCQRHNDTWARSAILKRYVGLKIFMGDEKRGDAGFGFTPFIFASKDTQNEVLL
jgi:hypothetical protein